MTHKNIFTRSFLNGSTAFSALALLGAGFGTSIIAAAPAMAQDITSGEISGVVQDANGNPVSGATVTLSATARGLTRTATTGSSGAYTFGNIPLGNYDLSATSPELGTARVEGASAQLGGAAYVITLGADSGGETIVVTGQAARTIDFSQGATGRVFDVQETAARIPVPRTVEAIQLLAPQAVSGDSAFGANGRSTVSLSGASVAENIYYINGMNITNFRTFVGGSTVPFEFYDQVQVKTGAYQAEFGRSTGGAIIAVTRSGSNEFRGGFNFFWSPNQLREEAPDTFSQDNSRDDTEDYSGNVYASGPVIKDRLYFFGFFNPRYERTTDYNIAGTRAIATRDKPFWGGKLDADLFDGHRLEFTYFNDQNDEDVVQTTFNPDGSVATESDTTNFAGGDNMIARYTGTFADWITVSGLWGQSKYNQTSQGSADVVPYVLDGRSGTLLYVAGNPNGLIEVGKDKRTQYRADVDLFFNAMGEHHIRFGADHEVLEAVASTIYSGNVYYRYYTAGASGAFGGAIAPGQDYVRGRIINSGGTFKSKNTAFYVQDNWDVTDRLNLSLGVRNDRFKNLNASGNPFTDLKNQWAPRLGANFDLFGDRRTKLSAFYGRYFLPVAANTNIRLAGDEIFTEQYFSFTGEDANGVPTGLTAVTDLTYLSNSSNPDPTTLVSQNLEPQYLDEFILGAETRVGDRWRVGVNLIHRKLGAVLEDADLNQYATAAFCGENPDACGGESDLAVGSGGYVLLNPGKDVTINVPAQGGFAGGNLTIPAEYIDLPKAKRKYWAVEFNFDREFDGVWSLAGSYVWSRNRGNYEGGVKSDNGQDDVGLTQDYDEPGWQDGAYGYLPNHREHVFKIYGTFAPTENLLLGFNARLASGRKFGCIGIYPFEDDRAQNPYAVGGADSWYCANRDGTITGDDDNQFVVSPVGTPDSILVGRGNGFTGAWEKRIDLSVAYRLPVKTLRNVTLRADVFNVFNFKKPLDYYEYGDEDTAISQDADNDFIPLDENYGKPLSYQTPRYFRFSISVDF